MDVAPIALFVYKRLEHTKSTIKSLQANDLAKKSKLYIFSDAEKNVEDTIYVREVRRYISEIDGFKSIEVVKAGKNMGLANSIISGVTRVVKEHGKVIVLEDDMLVSQFFLDYMNRALKKYAVEKMVFSIHGYMYPVSCDLPETFFMEGADCWGWATWLDRWQYFESDANILLEDIKRRNLQFDFDIRGSFPFTNMLHRQGKGAIDSWAIRWRASVFLRGGLTLWPARSLVKNIGLDGTGEHCHSNNSYDVELSEVEVQLVDVPIQASKQAEECLAQYFRDIKPGIFFSLKRAFRRITRAIFHNAGCL